MGFGKMQGGGGMMQNDRCENFLYLRKNTDLILLAQMNREITIINKEEAYTYDELDLIEEKLLPLVNEGLKVDVGQVLSVLKLSLENQKTSSAIFFMPQNTFNIFSLIQGDNAICKITKENIEALYFTFDLINDQGSQPIYKHLQKKLRTLYEYLEQGNAVTPTAITADNFTILQI